MNVQRQWCDASSKVVTISTNYKTSSELNRVSLETFLFNNLPIFKPLLLKSSVDVDMVTEIFIQLFPLKTIILTTATTMSIHKHMSWFVCYLLQYQEWIFCLQQQFWKYKLLRVAWHGNHVVWSIGRNVVLTRVRAVWWRKRTIYKFISYFVCQFNIFQAPPLPNKTKTHFMRIII